MCVIRDSKCCFTTERKCRSFLINWDNYKLISPTLFLEYLETRIDWQVCKCTEKYCDHCGVSFCNPGSMTMQILADGYVNVNVVILLKLDIVTHLINLKYINFSRKFILKNILESFHPFKNSSYLLFVLMGILRSWQNIL